VATKMTETFAVSRGKPRLLEEWRQYVERSEMYFEVNNVPDLRRVPFVPALMGSQMYALSLLLGPISVPREPKELSFTELFNTLAKHFGLEVVDERFMFRKRSKKSRNLFDNTLSSYRGEQRFANSWNIAKSLFMIG